jgi:gamma-glutamylcyclotransferase
MKYYFAYGSNMLIERLQARVPSAKPVSHARIEGWRLQFDKRSVDGSGKCHIVPSTGDVVYGVVFFIPLADRGKLDEVEGRHHGYERQWLREVILGDGSKVQAFTYVADPDYVQAGLLTFDWYHDLVVAGAEQHHLPSDYIDGLKSTPSRPDPEVGRLRRAEALKVLSEFRSKVGMGPFPFHRPSSAMLHSEEELEHLSETTLYYPCSGRDWADPLRLFGPWVRNIRFVEPSYSCRLSVNCGQLSIRGFPEWKFLGREIDGDPTRRICLGLGQHIEEKVPDSQPLTISELYRHLPSGREVTIHWHQGDGRKTLNRFNDSLGVFFHRGDSGPCKNPGESASGSHWLSKEWLEPVIRRLVNRGFIVTDGSCGREYPELCRFYNHRTMNGEDAVAQAKEFTSDGVHFKCVGFAGMRYGPTLIWQISK